MQPIPASTDGCETAVDANIFSASNRNRVPTFDEHHGQTETRVDSDGES